ncbi:TRNA-specific 2-thiouridylase [Actinidia chinensis var. chinensis]|uniref:tRNA-specific 2-thiouridylase n=1 Tax=Actinidia chinensis var. chinensis TaxID=1590841 RepID=A0A2R6PAD3_ACTCC|nr:TRNA-specific 2-thiouridylase [Actinidia chinensis var. chinensis]
MSMHAKTDSEVTSLAPSSPARSPRGGGRAVYYVQSPSRDSHDGEKTTNSFHSTPVLSPVGSPGRHSRHSSSSTRFSSKSSAAAAADRRRSKGDKQWKEFNAIEEEGLLDDDNARRRRSCRCYFLGFLVAFFVLFSFFSLVLWGASRNQKPIVTMKSISFDKFAIQAGNDDSGVATEMVTMNSTVKFVYRNTGTFFGIHVTSTLLDLSYSESQLTLATGSINKFYQSRKSQRTLTVMMQGTRVPLYGGGVDLSSKDGIPTAPVPLTLSFMVRSRAYVLGKLVKPNFKKRVQCSVVLDPKKMNMAISLKNSCT